MTDPLTPAPEPEQETRCVSIRPGGGVCGMMLGSAVHNLANYRSHAFEAPLASEPEGAPKPETTHRCKVCGAHWRLNEATEVQPGGSWSLVYPFVAGKCCDNVAMGSQIEAIGEPLRCAHCREEIRPEGNGWMDAETCTSCEDTGEPHSPRAVEPDSSLVKAREIVSAGCAEWDDDYHPTEDIIAGVAAALRASEAAVAEALRDARAEERERCAKIAEGQRARTKWKGERICAASTAKWYDGFDRAKSEIARVIRDEGRVRDEDWNENHGVSQ